MKLHVNGEVHDLAAATLADVLVLLDYQGDWLATAVNGELVHAEDRAIFQMTDRDRIEVLSPMQGG
jgi:thiamine biosynthesis protein ThiS